MDCGTCGCVAIDFDCELVVPVELCFLAFLDVDALAVGQLWRMLVDDEGHFAILAFGCCEVMDEEATALSSDCGVGSSFATAKDDGYAIVAIGNADAEEPGGGGVEG